jgi:hypothetical protein
MRRMQIAAVFAALLVPQAVHAVDRPMPVPQQGHSGCAPGYSLSPTSRMCAPTLRAFPAQRQAGIAE